MESSRFQYQGPRLAERRWRAGDRAGQAHTPGLGEQGTIAGQRRAGTPAPIGGLHREHPDRQWVTGRGRLERRHPAHQGMLLAGDGKGSTRRTHRQGREMGIEHRWRGQRGSRRLAHVGRGWLRWLTAAAGEDKTYRDDAWVAHANLVGHPPRLPQIALWH